MEEMASPTNGTGSTVCRYPACGAGVPVALLVRDEAETQKKIAGLESRFDRVEALLGELITSLKAFRLVVGFVMAVGAAIVSWAKAGWPGLPGGVK